MAKLFYVEEQNAALRDIQSALKTLSGVNDALAIAEAEDVKIKVAGTDKDGTNKTANATVPYELIIPSLREYKKKLVALINTKSKQFHIQLEPAEEALLTEK